MKKILARRGIIIAIVVILLISYWIYGVVQKAQKTTYLTEKATKGNVIKEVTETGTVRANEEIKLGFQASGKISDIYVKIGDSVKAGQELAKLNTTDLLIQLAEATAALNTAKAQKTDASVTLKGSEQSLDDVKKAAEDDLNNAYEDAVNSIDDAYMKVYNAYSTAIEIQHSYFPSQDYYGYIVYERKDQIKRDLDNAKKYIDVLNIDKSQSNIDATLSKFITLTDSVGISLEKIRDVVKTESIYAIVSTADRTAIDTQKTNINTAYNDLVSAKQTIENTKISNETNINDALTSVESYSTQLKDSKNGLYQSQIAQAEAKISLLNNQIKESSIKSPIDGRITDVTKKVGETAPANDSFISMLSDGMFQIKVDIYEEDIVTVKPGDTVKINLVAFPDEPLKGKVVSVDPAERLIDDIVYYRVTIDFEEMKEGVRNGMTADIAILTGQKDNVLMIPKRAIEKINGQKTVKVLKKNKPEERQIKTGLEGNDYAEILSGVSEGELVITGTQQ